MLIHIDGPDLCWKSTLIDKMQRLFKNVIVFKTPKEYLPREDSKEAREKIWNFYIRRANEAYETLKQDPSKIIILDRFFLSELVYWKIIRWYNSSDVKDKISELSKILEKIDKEFGYTIIFLWDRLEDVRKRFQRDWDDYVKDKKYFEKLINEYWETTNWYSDKFNVYEINVFDDIDYWNTIIESVLLSNYKYIRQ